METLPKTFGAGVVGWLVNQRSLAILSAASRLVDRLPADPPSIGPELDASASLSPISQAGSKSKLRQLRSPKKR